MDINFEHSWIYDERFGWTLMIDDFKTPVIDAPIVFKDTANDLLPNPITTQKIDDYILWKDKPAKIVELNKDCQQFWVHAVSREKPHKWEDEKLSKQEKIELHNNYESPLRALLEITLNVYLNDDTLSEKIVRQTHIYIKRFLNELSPVILEVHDAETNLSDQDTNIKYFQNSKFCNGMELDVMCLTRDDIKQAKLFSELAFKPAVFNWNCYHSLEDVRLVGFGVAGAYRNITQTGGAKCTMKVTNQNTKQEQTVDCQVQHMDFDIHSFFFDKAIIMNRGDPVSFNPVNPIGNLYEISSSCQEFCGSDGVVFNQSCQDNCIAMQYYY